MSIVRTAKEWIESLQQEDPDKVYLGNLYSAEDVRQELIERGCDEDAKTDDELLEMFRSEYDDNEETAYYDTIHALVERFID